MKHKLQAVLIAMLLFLTALSTHATDSETAYQRVMRTGTIKCGYSPWPMYWDVDPNTQKISGLGKNLSDATFKLLGLKVEYVEYNFSNKVIDLQSGKIDATCMDGPWILTSLKQMDYSIPFMYSPVYAYVREDEKRFSIHNDLNKADVKFVGIDGDLSIELVQNNFPNAGLNTLAATVDPSQMLLDVSTKKADVTILDPAAGSNFIEHNPGKVKQLFGKPLAVYNEGFGVKNGEVDLLNMLNGAVAAMHNTGAVDPIIDKYDPKGEKFLKVQPGFVAK